MKRRFILYRRKLGGTFYLEDTQTRKQESLGTKDRAEAMPLLHARNESVRQPQLNLQIAKAYLSGTDSGVSKRTWQDAFNAIIENKHGSTKERWQRAVRQKAFDLILPLIIIETQAEQLFACLKAGTVSTNVHLRELLAQRHRRCIRVRSRQVARVPDHVVVAVLDHVAAESERHFGVGVGVGVGEAALVVEAAAAVQPRQGDLGGRLREGRQRGEDDCGEGGAKNAFHAVSPSLSKCDPDRTAQGACPRV